MNNKIKERILCLMLARAVSRKMSKVLILSTSDTPDTALSPAYDTIRVSNIPTDSIKACSIIKGMIILLKDFLENIPYSNTFAPCDIANTLLGQNFCQHISNRNIIINNFYGFHFFLIFSNYGLRCDHWNTACHLSLVAGKIIIRHINAGSSFRGGV